jgi:hypothetical protein
LKIVQHGKLGADSEASRASLLVSGVKRQGCPSFGRWGAISTSDFRLIAS